MGRLTSAPAEVVLEVKRNVIVKKPRGVVAGQDAAPAPSQLEKSFERNFGSTEKTAKTLNKVAKITANPVTWKNPIYFWSIAGTAALFLPIIYYVVTKG